MGYSMDAISKNLSYKIIRILNQVLVTVHFAKYILCSENPRAAGNNSNNNNNYNNHIYSEPQVPARVCYIFYIL